MRILPIVLLFTAIASTTHARVVHVKWDCAGPAHDGQTWDTAYTTLLDGVAASTAGDELWVARGTYVGSLILKDGTALYGGFAGTEIDRTSRNWKTSRTTITSSGVDQVARLGNGCTIDGFTIRGGIGGIYAPNKSQLIICNNFITDNLWCGVYLGGGSSVTISGNVLAGNASEGVYAYFTNGVSITNNTISGNVKGMSLYYTTATIANNIVAHNVAVGIDDYGGCALTLASNCVYGHRIADYNIVDPRPTDIMIDPAFVSKDYGEYHLKSASPCRNRGDNAYVPADARDIDGQSRIEGTSVDIGADESYGETYPSYRARVIRVMAQAATPGDGSDWSTPFRTINDALNDIDANGPADVWIAGGTDYREKIRMRAFSYLYGGFAGTETTRTERNIRVNETVIDGIDWTGPTVRAGSTCRIDGFTIIGGSMGIYCDWGAMNIANNIVRGADTGIECYEYCSSVVNNLIYHNNVGVRCVWTGYDGAVLTNNTIVDNTLHGLWCDNASPAVQNTLIAFNGQHGVYNQASDAEFCPWFAATLVYGNSGGDYNPTSIPHSGNISSDPLFFDRAGHDFHLLPGSPALDKSASYGPTTDLDGIPRPKNANNLLFTYYDIGCYEAPRSYKTLLNTKGIADGTFVGITGCVVTAALPDRFYVETTGRLCGIGVLAGGAQVGRRAFVEGTMATVNGERVIMPNSSRFLDEMPTPAPWFISPTGLGGGQLGLQGGVNEWRCVRDESEVLQRLLVPCGGASNIGLLVKSAGRISHVGANFFYLEGSGNSDDGDPAVRGLRVDWPFAASMPESGSFVEVTGVSSCRVVSVPDVGEVVVRLLRPVSPESVQVLLAE